MVACLLLHRYTLTCDGCFIHTGITLQHDTIHRYQTSGLYQKYITLLQTFRRHLLLLPVPGHENCHLGSQIHKLGNSLTGLALGTALQIFSDRDQGQDRTGGFKIQIVGIMLYYCHVTVA